MNCADELLAFPELLNESSNYLLNNKMAFRPLESLHQIFVITPLGLNDVIHYTWEMLFEVFGVSVGCAPVLIKEESGENFLLEFITLLFADAKPCHEKFIKLAFLYQLSVRFFFGFWNGGNIPDQQIKEKGLGISDIHLS